MTLSRGRLPPGTRGVARELLDQVADIANILAHQNAPQRQRSRASPRARDEKPHPMR
jgi:hypothetical protein